MRSLLIGMIGLTVCFVGGAIIDAVVPGLDLLGFNIQGLVWSTACLIFAVWVLHHYDLLD